MEELLPVECSLRRHVYGIEELTILKETTFFTHALPIKFVSRSRAPPQALITWMTSLARPRPANLLNEASGKNA